MATIQFTIQYESKTETFLSNNMNLSTTEEKDWNDNFATLKKQIESTFPSLSGKNYEIQDNNECDVKAYQLQELCNDGNTLIALKIVCDNEEEKQIENIYQQLKINVPKTAFVKFHRSGILDDN
eukprot:491113_1